jgi:hypothetical protein
MLFARPIKLQMHLDNVAAQTVAAKGRRSLSWIGDAAEGSHFYERAGSKFGKL